MISISLMSNGYIAAASTAYFTLVRIYFLQYYYFDLSNRMITFYTSSNKFGISFVYGMFTALPVICYMLLNHEDVVNKTNVIVFSTHILCMFALLLHLKSSVNAPKLGEFVLLNMSLAIKELLNRSYLSEANGYLNMICNLTACTYFIKIVIERAMTKGRISMTSTFGLNSNLGYNGRSLVPTTQPNDIPLEPAIRREAINTSIIELFKLKRYLNALFYAFEVVFDNLLVFQHTKSKMHILPLGIRAIVSPVILMFTVNTIFQVKDIPKYLGFIGIGLCAGLINFTFVMRNKYYRLLNIYNLVVVFTVELLLLSQVKLHKSITEASALSRIAFSLFDTIQVCLPGVFMAISAGQRGFEGISYFANIIAYSLVSLFYSGLVSSVFFSGTLTTLSSLLKMALSFQLLTAILPHCNSLIFKRKLNRISSGTLALILPLYYVLANEFTK